jgi:hypothetical protein
MVSDSIRFRQRSFTPLPLRGWAENSPTPHLTTPVGAKREKRDQSLTWHHKITDQALAPFARSYYGWFIAQYNTSGIWQNKRCRYAATNQSNCRDRLFCLWLPCSQTKLLPVSNYHTLNPLGRRWDSRWDNRWPNTIWRFSKSK